MVDLLCKAITVQGSYQWQMSGDQKTRVDLPQTAKATIRVTGLTPVTMMWFRYRTITAAGLSDWSAAVSVIVH